MKYLLIFRNGDDGIIKNYEYELNQLSADELIRTFNREYKKGITGNHNLALYLYAIANVFLDRFHVAPIRIDDNLLSMIGEVELVKTWIKFTNNNGKLLIMVEMNEPPWGLMEYAENVLNPLGFRKYEDYLFACEQLVPRSKYEEDPCLNKPIPGCENIPWLDSRVTRQGNFVWHTCL